MEEQHQKEKMYEFIPILAFIAVYFVIQAFDWMEATKIVIGVFFSFMAYMVMTSLLKEDRDMKPEQIRRVTFQSGLLSFIFMLLFASGFLHWYRMVSNFWRMGVLLFLLLIYFSVLFRSMRILSDYRRSLKPK